MRTAERLFKALANRRRLAILLYLDRVREATLVQISEEFRLPYKTVAWNLRKLLQVDLVEAERRGIIVYHSLSFTLRYAASLRAMLTFVRKSAMHK